MQVGPRYSYTGVREAWHFVHANYRQRVPAVIGRANVTVDDKGGVVAQIPGNGEAPHFLYCEALKQRHGQPVELVCVERVAEWPEKAVVVTDSSHGLETPIFAFYLDETTGFPYFVPRTPRPGDDGADVRYFPIKFEIDGQTGLAKPIKFGEVTLYKGTAKHVNGVVLCQRDGEISEFRDKASLGHSRDLIKWHRIYNSSRATTGIIVGDIMGERHYAQITGILGPFRVCVESSGDKNICGTFPTNWRNYVRMSKDDFAKIDVVINLGASINVFVRMENGRITEVFAEKDLEFQRPFYLKVIRDEKEEIKEASSHLCKGVKHDGIEFHEGVKILIGSRMSRFFAGIEYINLAEELKQNGLTATEDSRVSAVVIDGKTCLFWALKPRFSEDDWEIARLAAKAYKRIDDKKGPVKFLQALDQIRKYSNAAVYGPKEFMRQRALLKLQALAGIFAEAQGCDPRRSFVRRGENKAWALGYFSQERARTLFGASSKIGPDGMLVFSLPGKNTPFELYSEATFHAREENVAVAFMEVEGVDGHALIVYHEGAGSNEPYFVFYIDPEEPNSPYFIPNVPNPKTRYYPVQFEKNKTGRAMPFTLGGITYYSGDKRLEGVFYIERENGKIKAIYRRNLVPITWMPVYDGERQMIGAIVGDQRSEEDFSGITGVVGPFGLYVQKDRETKLPIYASFPASWRNKGYLTVADLTALNIDPNAKGLQVMARIEGGRILEVYGIDDEAFELPIYYRIVRSEEGQILATGRYSMREVDLSGITTVEGAETHFAKQRAAAGTTSEVFSLGRLPIYVGEHPADSPALQEKLRYASVVLVDGRYTLFRSHNPRFDKEDGKAVGLAITNYKRIISKLKGADKRKVADLVRTRAEKMRHAASDAEREFWKEELEKLNVNAPLSAAEEFKQKLDQARAGRSRAAERISAQDLIAHVNPIFEMMGVGEDMLARIRVEGFGSYIEEWERLKQYYAACARRNGIYYGCPGLQPTLAQAIRKATFRG